MSAPRELKSLRDVMLWLCEVESSCSWGRLSVTIYKAAGIITSITATRTDTSKTTPPAEEMAPEA